MTANFKVGDHVTWNSEAGHVSGPNAGNAQPAWQGHRIVLCGP
jgi:hypothetical protein